MTTTTTTTMTTTTLTVTMRGVAVSALTKEKADLWPDTMPHAGYDEGYEEFDWELDVTDDLGREWEHRTDANAIWEGEAAEFTTREVRGKRTNRGLPDAYAYLVVPYTRTWTETVSADAYDQQWDGDWTPGCWDLTGVEVRSWTDEVLTEHDEESYLLDNDDL